MTDERKEGTEPRGDGTNRLSMLLYGKEEPRKWLGGAGAEMLHDAADEIIRLRALSSQSVRVEWERLEVPPTTFGRVTGRRVIKIVETIKPGSKWISYVVILMGSRFGSCYDSESEAKQAAESALNEWLRGLPHA